MEKRDLHEEQETLDRLRTTLNAWEPEPPESLRPAAIVEMLEQKALPAQKPHRRRSAVRWLVPLAACLALTIGVWPLLAPNFMRKEMSDGTAGMETLEKVPDADNALTEAEPGNNSGAQSSQDLIPEQQPIFTPDTLQNMLKDGALLIDVREPYEVATGYIEGMVNIPLGSLADAIARYAPDHKQTIIVYCRTGNRSGQAQRLLQEMGYTTVYNLGGIQTDWPYPTVK